MDTAVFYCRKREKPNFIRVFKYFLRIHILFLFCNVSRKLNYSHSLILHTTIKPINSKREQNIRGHNPSSKNNTELLPITIIINITYIFTPRFRHLFSPQSLRIGPKYLFANNHLCHRFDDLAKQAAATIKKGVVGKIGIKIPVNPIPTNMKPNILKVLFFIKLIYNSIIVHQDL